MKISQDIKKILRTEIYTHTELFQEQKSFILLVSLLGFAITEHVDCIIMTEKGHYPCT